MRIAIAQIATRAGDFDGTARRMAEVSRRAADAGADLLVFPVAALCGVTPVQRTDREGFLIDLMECLLGLIDELACPCLLPVLLDTDEAALPEALLIDEGEIRPVRLAARLESASAGRGDASADALPEVPFRGARLGVAFTYDDLDVYDDYDYDVDVIVFLSGYGFAADDPSSALGTSLTEGRFLADAEATGAWVVGRGVARLLRHPGLLRLELRARAVGRAGGAVARVRGGPAGLRRGPLGRGPARGTPVTPEVYDAPLMTWGALGSGLSSLVREAGATGACVAVTGELAPMLAATLAVDALGPTNVSAVVARGMGAERDADALALVRALRLDEKDVEVVDVSAAEDDVAAEDLLACRLAALARRTGPRAARLSRQDRAGPRGVARAGERRGRGAVRRRLSLRPARPRAHAHHHLAGRPARRPSRASMFPTSPGDPTPPRPRRVLRSWIWCSRATSSGSFPSPTSSPSAAAPRRSRPSWGRLRDLEATRPAPRARAHRLLAHARRGAPGRGPRLARPSPRRTASAWRRASGTSSATRPTSPAPMTPTTSAPARTRPPRGRSATSWATSATSPPAGPSPRWGAFSAASRPVRHEGRRAAHARRVERSLLRELTPNAPHGCDSIERTFA